MSKFSYLVRYDYESLVNLSKVVGVGKANDTVC